MTAPATRAGELTAPLRALADPTRRRLLEELRQNEECVSVLASRLGITTALVSHHLHTLMGAGLVQERHHGAHRCYSLAPERLGTLRDQLDGLLDPALPVTALPGANPCGS